MLVGIAREFCNRLAYNGRYAVSFAVMRLGMVTFARCVVLPVLVAVLSVPAMAASKQAPIEPYIHEPMPAGVQVVGTEMDGPVFADAQGRTLYMWPQREMDNGIVGEAKGKPACDETHYTKTTGAMDPWPPGLELPDLATRPVCTALWPPFLAADDAKAVGKWSIVARNDGRKQWAYDDFAVYTSSFDHEPGDAIGVHQIDPKTYADTGGFRVVIAPKPDIPAQFAIANIPTGRLLTLVNGYSVYTSDRDPPNKSVCDDACQQVFKPVIAAVTAPQSRGDWGVTERSPGVWQWTFRKKPLYALASDQQTRSFHGADIQGWHNVYTTHAPAWPKGFTVQDNPGGQVLADARGKTIYFYTCTDDGFDQQACDHPSLTQAYRLAVCGGFDAKKCAAQFPYVIADKNAKSDSRIWAIKDIDPMTGRYVEAGAPGALHVWTYRDRPIYTYAGDQVAGDTRANSWGEGNGWRNGYHAFWVREEFRKQF
jgi:predicted lipoprotein with Yx(FWY)xxD motif